MEQTNAATADELQQAINSITNGGAATGAADAVAQAAAAVPAAGEAATVAADSAAAAVAAAAVPTAPIMPMKAQYGDPDLDRVKSMALSDLRPLLEKVDIPAEKKFIIYKDILELTEDKACIEPAYVAARQIADEKTKGEALVFIVECIDKLGIQMPVGSEEEEEQ